MNPDSQFLCGFYCANLVDRCRRGYGWEIPLVPNQRRLFGGPGCPTGNPFRESRVLSRRCEKLGEPKTTRLPVGDYGFSKGNANGSTSITYENTSFSLPRASVYLVVEDGGEPELLELAIRSEKRLRIATSLGCLFKRT